MLPEPKVKMNDHQVFVSSEMWARVQYDRWTDEATAAATGHKDQQERIKVDNKEQTGEVKVRPQQQVTEKIKDKDASGNLEWSN